MNNDIITISESIPGSFGDGKVLIQGYIVSNIAPLVVLLHGVHGCANLSEGNKYATLARLLAENSINVLVLETSRKIRDREHFGDDRDRWVKEAFDGKTYAMDLFDVASAIVFIKHNMKKTKLWLWGFSLGGLHFLIISGNKHDEILGKANMRNPLPELPELPDIHGLILSGSGDEIRPENNLAISEPILNSLPERQTLLEAAKNTKAKNVFAFYGSMDETFSEEACRRLFDLTPTKRSFIVLNGVDHSFRSINGIQSIAPLVDMLNYIKPYLLG